MHAVAPVLSTLAITIFNLLPVIRKLTNYVNASSITMMDVHAHVTDNSSLHLRRTIRNVSRKYN